MKQAYKPTSSATGMYLVSLVCDGIIIDSKNLIIE